LGKNGKMKMKMKIVVRKKEEVNCEVINILVEDEKIKKKNVTHITK
jgi:hypothetical protein